MDPRLSRLLLALLEPGRALLGGAVVGRPSAGASRARLLVALELVERGEQRPGLRAVLVDEPQQATPATDGRLELDPRGRDAVGLVGGLAGDEPAGIGVLERRAEQVRHARGVLDGGEVPGEGDQVAPEAGGGEHARRPVDVARPQGVLEVRQPGVDPGLRVGRRRGWGGGPSGSWGLLRRRTGSVTQHTPEGAGRDRVARCCSRAAGPGCDRGARHPRDLCSGASKEEPGGRVQCGRARHRPVPACPRAAPRARRRARRPAVAPAAPGARRPLVVARPGDRARPRRSERPRPAAARGGRAPAPVLHPSRWSSASCARS